MPYDYIFAINHLEDRLIPHSIWFIQNMLPNSTGCKLLFENQITRNSNYVCSLNYFNFNLHLFNSSVESRILLNECCAAQLHEHKWWNRELTLKCKFKCYVKPMKDPLGVSPSKGNHGTTRGKEKIISTSVEIEPMTSGFDLPLLCRLNYEAGQRKSGTIQVVNHGEEKVRVHMNVVPRSTMNTNGGTEN